MNALIKKLSPRKPRKTKSRVAFAPLAPPKGGERPATLTPQRVRPIEGGQESHRAAGRLLVAGTPERGLLLCAKHLFGGAIRHPGAPDRRVSPRPLQSKLVLLAVVPLSFARLLTANTTKQRLSQNPVSAIFSSPATATTPRMIIAATATIRLLNREAAPAGRADGAPRIAGCTSERRD